MQGLSEAMTVKEHGMVILGCLVCVELQGDACGCPI
jgi:hypothetical protein